MNANLGRLAAATVLAIIPLRLAHAHHAGGSGNTSGAGPINTISAETLEAGLTLVGVTIDYTSLNTLSDSTLFNATAAGIEGVHGLKTLQSYNLVAAYGVTNDLMLSMRLPWVRRTGIAAAEKDAASNLIEVLDHGGADGVGDISMQGQYRFLNSGSFEVAALLGFTAPTGPTNRRSRQSELLDAEFQPSSGAWAGNFGLAFTHRAGPWSFDANVMYELNGEGTQTTDLGDIFLYNVAISHRLTALPPQGPMFHGKHAHDEGDDGHHHAASEHATPAAAVDLVLEINGQWHEKQVQSGLTDDNSGGQTIFLSPGLRVTAGNISAFASLGVPLLNDFNGIQPDNDWHLTSGVVIGF